MLEKINNKNFLLNLNAEEFEKFTEKHLKLEIALNKVSIF